MRRYFGLGLLSLLLAATATSAGNIVENGDFGDGRPPWKLFSDAFIKDFSVDDGTAVILIGPRSRNSQLFQAPLSLDGNREYELSFYASLNVKEIPLAPAPTEGFVDFGEPLGMGATASLREKALSSGMIVALSQHGAPYENYGLRRLAHLNSELQKFVYRFTTTEGDKDDVRLRFAFDAPRRLAEYRIANVVLRPVDCGNGITDDFEECDDGNNEPGDGCDSTCVVECQINYAHARSADEVLYLAGGNICTLDGEAGADPQVFIGTRDGSMVELPVLTNDSTSVQASLRPITPLQRSTHKVIVGCPGVAKEIDVTVDAD